MRPDKSFENLAAGAASGISCQDAVHLPEISVQSYRPLRSTRKVTHCKKGWVRGPGRKTLKRTVRVHLIVPYNFEKNSIKSLLKVFFQKAAEFPGAAGEFRWESPDRSQNSMRAQRDVVQSPRSLKRFDLVKESSCEKYKN
jgi:hypothetical protein